MPSTRRSRSVYPETRIYILAVKPSIARWQLWPTMAMTNDMLKARADNDPRLTFIDIATPMLGEDGEPLGEIFVADMLHMNGKGYDIWRDAVRPRAGGSGTGLRIAQTVRGHGGHGICSRLGQASA